jgi:hypothetical protein
VIQPPSFRTPRTAKFEEMDADGDGEVGPGDFEIIVENFGLAGDL